MDHSTGFPADISPGRHFCMFYLVGGMGMRLLLTVPFQKCKFINCQHNNLIVMLNMVKFSEIFGTGLF